MVINDQSSDQEIHHFNQLAKQWWDPEGPMKPLHQLNPVRMDYIEQHATIAGQNVLDVGCGGGLLSEALAKAGAHVTAIDLSETLIQTAAEHAKKHNLSINYQQRRISEQVSLGEQFDVITCLEMLEHVDNPKTIIEQCSQCLKPGGILFVSTLNRHPRAFLLGILAAEYLLRWLPIGTHHYKQFIKPSELNRYAREAGLTRHHIAGINYDISNKRFFINDDWRVNYIASFIKPKDNS